MTFRTPTPNPRNSITNNSQGVVPNHWSSTQPTIAAPNGSADQMTEDQLARPVVRLPGAGPLRFRLLQTVEPLIERFEPCIWWKLRDLAGFVLCHASPLCVAPAEIQGPGKGEEHGGKRHRQGAAPL